MIRKCASCATPIHEDCALRVTGCEKFCPSCYNKNASDAGAGAGAGAGADADAIKPTQSNVAKESASSRKRDRAKPEPGLKTPEPARAGIDAANRVKSHPVLETPDVRAVPKPRSSNTIRDKPKPVLETPGVSRHSSTKHLPGFSQPRTRSSPKSRGVSGLRSRPNTRAAAASASPGTTVSSKPNTQKLGMEPSQETPASKGRSARASSAATTPAMESPGVRSVSRRSEDVPPPARKRAISEPVLKLPSETQMTKPIRHIRLVLDHDINATAALGNIPKLTATFPMKRVGFLRHWEMLTHIVTNASLCFNNPKRGLTKQLASAMHEICKDMVVEMGKRFVNPMEHPRFGEINRLLDEGALPEKEPNTTVLFDQFGNEYPLSLDKVASVADRGEWMHTEMFEFLSRAFDGFNSDFYVVNPFLAGRMFCQFTKKVTPAHRISPGKDRFETLVSAISTPKTYKEKSDILVWEKIKASVLMFLGQFESMLQCKYWGIPIVTNMHWSVYVVSNLREIVSKISKGLLITGPIAKTVHIDSVSGSHDACTAHVSTALIYSVAVWVSRESSEETMSAEEWSKCVESNKVPVSGGLRRVNINAPQQGGKYDCGLRALFNLNCIATNLDILDKYGLGRTEKLLCKLEINYDGYSEFVKSRAKYITNDPCRYMFFVSNVSMSDKRTFQFVKKKEWIAHYSRTPIAATPTSQGTSARSQPDAPVPAEKDPSAQKQRKKNDVEKKRQVRELPRTSEERGSGVPQPGPDVVSRDNQDPVQKPPADISTQGVVEKSTGMKTSEKSERHERADPEPAQKAPDADAAGAAKQAQAENAVAVAGSKARDKPEPVQEPPADLNTQKGGEGRTGKRTSESNERADPEPGQKAPDADAIGSARQAEAENAVSVAGSKARDKPEPVQEPPADLDTKGPVKESTGNKSSEAEASDRVNPEPAQKAPGSDVVDIKMVDVANGDDSKPAAEEKPGITKRKKSDANERDNQDPVQKVPDVDVVDATKLADAENDPNKMETDADEDEDEDGMECFKSFREMIAAFEQSYLSFPGSSIRVSFEQKIRVEGYEDNFTHDVSDLPLLKPYAVNRHQTAQSREAARKLLSINEDRKLAFLKTAGNVIVLLFAEDIGMSVSDDMVEPIDIRTKDAVKSGLKNMWVFKKGCAPQIPEDWIVPLTSNGGKRYKDYRVPGSVFLYIVDGSNRVMVIATDKLDIPISFYIAVIPPQQMREKPDHVDKLAYCQQLVSVLAEGINSLTHGNIQNSFSQDILWRSVQRQDYVDSCVEDGARFEPLEAGFSSWVTPDTFSLPTVSKSSSYFTAGKPKDGDGNFTYLLPLLHGVNVPTKTKLYIMKSKLPESGDSLGIGNLDLMFLRGRISLNKQRMIVHSCTRCTSDRKVFNTQEANTSAFEYLDKRGGEDNVEVSTLFDLKAISWSTFNAMTHKGRVVAEEILGSVPARVRIIKNGRNYVASDVPRAREHCAEMERQLISGVLVSYTTMVAVMLLDENECAIKAQGEVTNEEGVPVAALPIVSTDFRKLPIKLYQVATGKNTDGNVITRKLPHHNKTFAVVPCDGALKKRFFQAYDISICIVKAVHAVVASMLGLKSIEVLFNLSDMCSLDDVPAMLDNIPFSSSYQEALLFYYRYGWLCPPSELDMRSFCDSKPEVQIRVRSHEEALQGLSDLDPEVCNLVFKARHKIADLLMSLVRGGDSDLRFDVVVTHLIALRKEGSAGRANSFGIDEFIASPLLDLEVMKILYETAEKEIGSGTWTRLKMNGRFGRCAGGMRDLHRTGPLGESLQKPIVLRNRDKVRTDSLPGLIYKYINNNKDGRVIDGVPKDGVLKHLDEHRRTTPVMKQSNTPRKGLRVRRMKPWRRGSDHTVGSALVGIIAEQGTQKNEDMNGLTSHVCSLISGLTSKALGLDEHRMRNTLQQSLGKSLNGVGSSLYSSKGLKCNLVEFMEHFNIARESDDDEDRSGDDYEDGASDEVVGDEDEDEGDAEDRNDDNDEDKGEEDQQVGRGTSYLDDIEVEEQDGDESDIQPRVPMQGANGLFGAEMEAEAKVPSTATKRKRGRASGEGGSSKKKIKKGAKRSL